MIRPDLDRIRVLDLPQTLGTWELAAGAARPADNLSECQVSAWRRRQPRNGRRASQMA